MSSTSLFSTEIGQVSSVQDAPSWGGALSLADVVSTIGLVVVLSACVYIGRKLQILDDLKYSVGKIKNNVTIITNFLIKQHGEFDSTELQTFSPYTLTEKGRRFITALGFDKVFAENKEEFYRFIENEKPKYKYDVENASIKSIYAGHDKPFMAFLKVYFYNHPERSLENVAPTLGVYVRDKYLADHPEIVE